MWVFVVAMFYCQLLFLAKEKNYIVRDYLTHIFIDNFCSIKYCLKHSDLMIECWLM